jgi:hypothetical protein
MNTGEKSGTWDFSESNNICENSLSKKGYSKNYTIADLL